MIMVYWHSVMKVKSSLENLSREAFEHRVCMEKE